MGNAGVTITVSTQKEGLEIQWVCWMERVRYSKDTAWAKDLTLNGVSAMMNHYATIIKKSETGPAAVKGSSPGTTSLQRRVSRILEEHTDHLYITAAIPY